MKRSLVFLSKVVLFFFMFQTTAWAWEVQPNGAGLKVAWGGEKVAKRPPVTEQHVSKDGPRYLRLGGDPKDSNRALGPNEKIQVSTGDLWVETNSGSGKIYRGWLPAGTEFVTASTDNAFLRKAAWIKKCGNDVLNPESNAIFFRVQPTPSGRQIVQTAEPQPALSIQASPPPPVQEKSWWSENWGKVAVGTVVIIGVIIALSGGRGGGSNPALGPSPPPPGNN